MSELQRTEHIEGKTITFGIPCYNSADYMDHCISSILKGLSMQMTFRLSLLMMALRKIPPLRKPMSGQSAIPISSKQSTKKMVDMGWHFGRFT